MSSSGLVWMLKSVVLCALVALVDSGISSCVMSDVVAGELLETGVVGPPIAVLAG